MKGDWQVFRFEYIKKNGRRTGREVSAMGWLFYRNRVIIRKHIKLVKAGKRTIDSIPEKFRDDVRAAIEAAEDAAE